MTSQADLQDARIEIRDATDADTEAMVAIAVKAWEPVFFSFRELMGDALFAMIYHDWRDDKASQIKKAAAPDSPVDFIVSVAGGEVVGFASWHIREDARRGKIAEIGNNAVSPTWQNHGIATSQYNKIIRRCTESGARAIQVTTGLDPSHAPARRAYEKAGFGAGIPMVTYWQEL